MAYIYLTAYTLCQKKIPKTAYYFDVFLSLVYFFIVQTYWKS